VLKRKFLQYKIVQILVLTTFSVKIVLTIKLLALTTFVKFRVLHPNALIPVLFQRTAPSVPTIILIVPSKASVVPSQPINVQALALMIVIVQIVMTTKTSVIKGFVESTHK